MNLEELQAKITELEKINEEKTNLMAVGAHELRTLLTSLKWIVQMMLDGDVGALPAEQSNLLSKARENIERMILIAGDMLTIGHTTDLSQIKQEKKLEDLVLLIDNVLFNFTGESYKKGIEILFLKPEAGFPLSLINRDHVRVILQNLVENAIKYSCKGDRIFITVTDLEQTIRISVKDTGIGIPKKDQEKIFGKFFRTDTAIVHEAMGTGLGLYTSKIIAEQDGGTLTFESIQKTSEEKPHGTTFFLDLPKIEQK